jgi:hypothetical protein
LFNGTDASPECLPSGGFFMTTLIKEFHARVDEAEREYAAVEKAKTKSEKR